MTRAGAARIAQEKLNRLFFNVWRQTRRIFPRPVIATAQKGAQKKPAP